MSLNFKIIFLNYATHYIGRFDENYNYKTNKLKMVMSYDTNTTAPKELSSNKIPVKIFTQKKRVNFKYQCLFSLSLSFSF